MKIAIIGTGNVGGALASQWAKAGHHIRLGVRDVNDFKGIELLNNNNTTVHSITEAIATSEVVLVATPPQFAIPIAEAFEANTTKVIIDATNAIRTRPEPHATAYHAFVELTDARIVKCFNTTGFENMKNPRYEDHQLDMFMAGDSDTAKSIATQLALDAGFANCYDFGKGDKVTLLEQFALAWINLAIFQGMGRNIGFKLLKK